MPSLAVIDFETTGATPAQGARATEVAICLLEGGRIVDRFASLMNAGVRVPSFITQLTGITNEMVADAPPADAMMREAAARLKPEHAGMQNACGRMLVKLGRKDEARARYQKILRDGCELDKVLPAPAPADGPPVGHGLGRALSPDGGAQ